MDEVRHKSSPDLLTYKKTLNRCECLFKTCKTADEALKKAIPAVMEHWAKIGFIERWRVMECTHELVRLEGLLIQVVDGD